MTRDEQSAQETIEKSTRLAVSGAAQLLAEGRERRAREITEAEAVEDERLQSRWDAERAAARVRVASADQAWLDNANVHETAGVWQTAAVWSQFEPDAFAADEARLAAEIQRRYGLDARAAGALGLDEAGDLRGLADAERQRQREHEDAARSASNESESLEDEVSAGVVLGGISQDAATDRAAAEQADAAAFERNADELDITADDVLYDSDGRRNALAQRAAAAGVDTPTVEGRVLAANANGRPGRLATSKHARTRATRMPAPQPAKDVQIER
ncbi:hypothetical protein [Aeromicrobium sp. 9AM]|uniref:hypothetical protein n=1 Tax=Aeromicrobium sp. 9AM TaxID=2653126 RepID=UPI00135BE78D|nr:hypothetical protein [Aeromicrobium sp. 9AM]